MTSAAVPPPSDAARRIRQYIVRRQLRPGDQLPTHDELGRRLKLGHRCLREGLGILRHQGMIETRNKGGTIVRQPTVKALSEPIAWHLDAAGCEFADLVSARAWLESGAAAEAAQRRTARDLLVIFDAFEQLETAARNNRNDVTEEEAFHLAIMQAAHNPVMLTFGQLISCQFQDRDAPPEPAGYRRTANREHRAIYDAIERQDDIAARDSMYAHVMGQVKHVGWIKKSVPRPTQTPSHTSHQQ